MSFEQLLSFLVILGVAFGLSLLLSNVARWAGFKVGIVDHPRDRHEHPASTSKFGSLALFGSFTTAAILAQFMPIERNDPNEIIRFIGLILGGIAAFVLGLIDDKLELPALPIYIGEILVAAIGVFFLIFIEKFTNPLTGQLTDPWPFFVTVTLSLFWFGLMMNTVNWLDGMDGLAAGVVLIAALLLFIHTILPDPVSRERQLSVSLLALALIGSTLGFLVYNWHPASIFMGGGALYLGYTIGALSIIGGGENGNDPARDGAAANGRRMADRQAHPERAQPNDRRSRAHSFPLD